MAIEKPEPRPKISVVIPAYNEEKYLGETLETVKAAVKEYQQKHSFAVEIIVVNNNSTDRTAQVAMEQGAQVVFEAKNQIAASRNAGGRVARGEIVAFLDADDHISSNLLTIVHEKLSSGHYIGGGVARIYREKTRMLATILERINNVLRRFSGLSTGLIYTFKDTFDRIGGFDERYYAAEEGKFVIALKKMGTKEGKAFCNIQEGYVIKSTRKFAQLSAPTLIWTWLKFLLGPWNLRSRKACSFWYDLGDGR